MKSGYTETRANGQPVADGYLCWKIEFEPGDPNYGEHAIYVNGRTSEEITQKLSLQNMHAQAALVKARTTKKTTTAQPAAAMPQTRKPLTADETMQATADLNNPAAAGRAAMTLVEEEAGLDLKQLAAERFERLAQEWEEEHPEYYRHPGNQAMVGDLAGRMVNRKLGLITKEILTTAFHQLRSQGLLFEDPGTQQQQLPPSPSLPVETQVQRTERPKHFTTGVRGTTLRPAQSAGPKSPKYTEAELRNMPEAKSRALIESGDKDYEFACEYHFGQRASA